MKRLLMLLLILTLMLPLAHGQTFPNQWVGAGATWNQYAAPQVNGVMAYAKRITNNDRPTYSFTAINILSASRNPFRVMTTTETGVAQYIGKFGPFGIYGIGTLGIAASGTEDGTDTGIVLGGGGMAQAKIGKGFTVGPLLRIVRAPNGDKQYPVGIVFGWGQ